MKLTVLILAITSFVLSNAGPTPGQGVSYESYLRLHQIQKESREAAKARQDRYDKSVVGRVKAWMNGS